MTTHRLRATLDVERPIEEVFAFFSRPENLGRITPPAMGFELRSRDLAMRDGLEIAYRVRPLLGIPAPWRSRVIDYDPPHGFGDLQLRGPYRRWEHRHTFAGEGDATRVSDEVTYELPLGPLGEVAHGLVVRRQLEEIFRYRAHAIRAIFATPEPNPAPRTVVVAGGTGFVGGGIAAEMHRRGHRVIVLGRGDRGSIGPLPEAVELRQADVTRDELGPALAGADALVIALAFKNSPIEAPRRGQTFMEVDAGGTERLVAAAREAGVGHVVYLSGAGAAPDAERHWFRAKWRAEEAVCGAGIGWTIIRPTWIFGPRDVSLNRFVGFARQLQVVPMTNLGRQPMAPVFIDDIGRLAADSITDPAARGAVLEIGGPETFAMREVIDHALRIAELRRPIVPGPTPLIKLGAWPLTLMPQPLLTPDAVDFINQPATVDSSVLLERMPRRLTPLDEGLATYLSPASAPGWLEIDAVSRPR
jgi:nucleoside-diphosphate-sugar epimerase/ligand-binding SRPBCC domain-containing protein